MLCNRIGLILQLHEQWATNAYLFESIEFLLVFSPIFEGPILIECRARASTTSHGRGERKRQRCGRRARVGTKGTPLTHNQGITRLNEPDSHTVAPSPCALIPLPRPASAQSLVH